MKKISLVLAAAGLFVISNARAQFASSVVAYTQGSGAISSYNNPNVVLGGPATTDGFANIDPFYAPYLSSQLVGVGTGGSLTLQFSTPIQNNAFNPFGLDFIIFGHAGFSITNGDYFGGGITDGTFYQGGAGSMQVSVSADGSTFYPLASPYGSQVDGLFPTDSSGNPLLPVNPAITAADFAGKDLAGIRALYNGSGGGTGFDLSWAGVPISSVSYVRLNVLSGAAYIDAVSVVPEPASVSIVTIAAAILLWKKRREA
jgi:hypothetical protein